MDKIVNRRHISAAALVPFTIATPQATPEATPEGMSDNQPTPLTDDQRADFVREAFTLHKLSVFELPYSRIVLRAVGAGFNLDDDGVVMYVADGKEYNQPVMQAQYIMRMISSYRATGHQQYLDAALANGRRLVEYSVVERGARYYPYPFQTFVHGKDDLALEPPWFSGLAQGQSLAALLRLARLDSSENWSKWANETFNSFLSLNDDDIPWSPNTDEWGYLWFEVYPVPGFDQEVFSGSVESLFGVYEYWLETGDERAVPLINGVLTTVKQRGPELRVEGGPSRYGMIHEVQSDANHQSHIAQLLELYAWTSDPAFAQLADQFASDYPPFSIENTLVVPPGQHTVGFLKSDKPHLVFTSTITREYPGTVEYRVLERRREVDSDRYWYRVITQERPIFWMLESADLHIDVPIGSLSNSGRLMPLTLIYEHPRAMQLVEGEYIGYLDIFGKIALPEVAIEIGNNTRGICRARGIINRQWHHLIRVEGNGEWIWVVADDNIDLD